jgi:hypothetical protein
LFILTIYIFNFPQGIFNVELGSLVRKTQPFELAADRSLIIAAAIDVIDPTSCPRSDPSLNGMMTLN